MRLAAVAFALTWLGAGPVLAQGCAAITDSLLRLRCYDEAAKGSAPPGTAGGTPPASPTGRTAPRAPNFGAYPVPVYRGRVVLPDFAGRDRQFSSFRTRIRDGMRSGLSFAGHMAIIQFGCGTGCSVVLAGDVRTGRVFSFPAGGEDNYSLELAFRPNSRLIAAQWENLDPEACVRATFEWTGERFAQVDRQVIGPREVCYSQGLEPR